MQLSTDPEFVSICRQVVEKGWTDLDWSERESSDWFQTPKFCGGYDADERAFCFSYYDPSGAEWWFQVSLSEVETISAGESVVIDLRLANPRERAVELVRRLKAGEAVDEAEENQLVAELTQLLPDPAWSDLVFWPSAHPKAASLDPEELTPERIVELAMAYRPLAP